MSSKVYTRANHSEVVPGIYRSWCLTHDDREGRVVCVESGASNLWVRVVGDKGNNLNGLLVWLEVNILSKITEDDFVAAVESDTSSAYLSAAYRKGKVVCLNNTNSSYYYVRSQNTVVLEDRVVAAPISTWCLNHDLSGIVGYFETDVPLAPGCFYRIENKERPHA